MLIDEIKIYARAGKGGDGVVRWRSEKYKPLMGPAGGNGGNGGDVYIRAVRNIEILSQYTKKREFFAENGQDGQKSSKHGRDGEDLYIDLPIGSVIKNLKTGQEAELSKEGQEVLVLKGGRGGLGNEHFKGSKNTTPKESTEGKLGEDAEFFVELQLIADAGFAGLPSAGKSTLLNELTSAKAKVGDYPFTTLEPNLGEFYGYILADIPGLIEGASFGKGLGHKFLKHIRRTELLVHCISVENENIIESYKIVRKELENFDSQLLNKPEIIVLTKSDMVEEEEVNKKQKKLSDLNKNTFVISILDDGSVKQFSDYLSQKLENLEKIKK